MVVFNVFTLLKPNQCLNCPHLAALVRTISKYPHIAPLLSQKNNKDLTTYCYHYCYISLYIHKFYILLSYFTIVRKFALLPSDIYLQLYLLGLIDKIKCITCSNPGFHDFYSQLVIPFHFWNTGLTRLSMSCTRLDAVTPATARLWPRYDDGWAESTPPSRNSAYGFSSTPQRRLALTAF